ncbi:hypothetical protein Nepgr_019218 [Nepenthes gracilis]|uniref:Glycosyltransferase 61 catalytic domain-containing protein n=1 Tax=Nepenthes gracilis TaxID=150966 RepID=A0AAD3SUJ2_NEPGR|nr:hypothetical protein Nepgr_019218 [Nepenthes gracilis]
MRAGPTRIPGDYNASLSSSLKHADRANHEIPKSLTQQKITKIIAFVFLSFLAILILYIIVSAFYSPDTSWVAFNPCRGAVNKTANNGETETLISKLRDSVTFLHLKDLKYAKTSMVGNTWFLSSFSDTYEKEEAEYLYFPSQTSKGRLLCIKGNDTRDGTENSYALAWLESLPRSAILLEGLSFISNTHYDFENLWHGVSSLAPFVGWSMKHGCLKPRRWVLFKNGALQPRAGSWLQKLMLSIYGEIPIERFQKGSDIVPYCFEKALVMRHNVGKMGREKKLSVYQQIRCKARSFCGINLGRDVNENGAPLIRVEGCRVKVFQSEDLSFCEQVEVLTYTDILASPHGAQMTNMIFMERGSVVMEFFPRGWLEYAGVGQHVFEWLAKQSGMLHPEPWWEKLDEIDCPRPQNRAECWSFYKNGKVGLNQTFFAQWARTQIGEVKLRKQISLNLMAYNSSSCSC